MSNGFTNIPNIKLIRINVGHVSELSPGTVINPFIDRSSLRTATNQTVVRSMNIL